MAIVCELSRLMVGEICHEDSLVLAFDKRSERDLLAVWRPFWVVVDILMIVY